MASSSPIELRDVVETGRPVDARRSRWWIKWVALAGAVAGLRLAVPTVLAPLVARRLSQALGAEVRVGDLGFRPLDGVVTLRDVRVTPQAEPSGGSPLAPIVAERVRADVQWLPLLHKTLRLRELLLDGAQVELERTPDGRLGLAGVADADPSRGLPEQWGFELDRVGLRDSTVRLRDPAAVGAKPFEVRVREGEISGLRRRATAFGRSANMRLDADVGSGRLASYGRYDLGDDGLSVDLRTRMKNVPVAEAIANVPDLGWGEVSGLLSGVVRWQRDPERRDKVSGRVVLRRGEIRVPTFSGPAFGVRRATADIDAVDLVERHVGIGNLVLQGASLAVRPDASDPVPLFGPGEAPSTPPAPTRAARRRGRATDDEDGDDKAPPWVWIVKKFDTPNGRIRSVTATGIVEARARASGENVGPRAYWSPVKLRVWSGEGAAVFDGTARIGRHFAAEGRVTAGGVDLGHLARAAGVHGAEWIQGGRLAADLNVQLDTGEREGQPLDATGPVLLSEVFLSGPIPGEFSAGATEASLSVTGIQLRGRGAKPSPVSALRCTDVRVQEPWLVLERTPAGLTVPTAAEDLVGPSAPATSTPTPVPAATPKPSRRRKPSKSEGTAGGEAGGDVAPPAFEELSPQLVLAGLRMANGRIVVVDRVPQPPVVWDVARVDGVGRDVRVPSPAVDGLRLTGHDSRFGDVQLSVRRGERRDGWDFAAQGMLLSAAAPYLQLAGLPFRFGGGTGSIDTRVSVGESDWTADTEITLRDPRFLGSVGALEDAMGRPISRAVFELRDDAGNLTLQLPLSSVDAAKPAALVQAIGKSVRDEIRRIALEPPRPPVQAPAPDDEEDAPAKPTSQTVPRPAPTPSRRRAEVARVDVVFPPGRADLNQLGVEQVSSVAKALLSRPELLVQLSVAITPEDRRWLAEQALGQELARPDALRGVLRAFGVGAARERIRAALVARAQGLPGLLSAEDEEELGEYLSERPAVGAAEVHSLREARISRVANRLSDYHGISRRRIEVERGEASGPAQPAVRVSVIDDTSRAAAPAPAAQGLPREPAGAPSR